MQAGPHPTPTPDTLPYWNGLREGRLLLQRCAACGVVRHYPRPVCTACFSMDVTWIEATGTGTVHSWTETHHPFLPALRDIVPYILITADLPEGVRVLAQLHGPSTDLQLGAQVACHFKPRGDWIIPIFTLTKGGC